MCVAADEWHNFWYNAPYTLATVDSFQFRIRFQMGYTGLFSAADG